MTRPVSQAGFTAASASYVAASVDKANADGNAFLTRQEARALPVDLQDNFDSFRARGTSRGVVGAQRFVEAYGAYVAKEAARADRNGNGYLSAAEGATLPADLQDNYANFRLGGPAPAEQSLQTQQERLDAIYNRQLPASSKLGETARQLDQELADQNIMSGVVGAASGKFSTANPSQAQLESWATAMAGDYLGETDGVKLQDAKVELLDPKEALERAGLAVAEGFAYDTSNPDNVRGVIDGADDGNGGRLLGLADAIKLLGPSVKAVLVTGKAEDPNGGSRPNGVGMGLFVDTQSGEFVGFYGREGRV